MGCCREIPTPTLGIRRFRVGSGNTKEKDMSKVSDEKWVSIGELVVALVGHRDSKAVAAITQHAKPSGEDGEGGKKLSGHASLPRSLCRHTSAPNNKRHKYVVKLSAESRVFFGNLLELESVFKPTFVADILTRRHLLDLRTTQRRIAEAKREIRARRDVYEVWLANLPVIEQRLLDRDFDLTKRSLVAAPDVEGPNRDDTPVRPLSLFHARALEDIDNRRAGTDDPVRDQAERALHSLSLGLLDIAEGAANEALTAQPNHPYANYSAAVVHLARAQQHQREGTRYAVMRDEADFQHENYWDDLAAEEQMSARDRKRKAITTLATALRHWPTHTSGDRKDYEDGRARDRAMAFILKASWEFSHEYGSLDFGDYEKLRQRHAGETVADFFGPGTDDMVLEAGRRFERRGGYELPWTSFQTATAVLQLYWVLSPDDYDRYRPKWLEKLKLLRPDDVARVIDPKHKRSLWAQVARQHLQNALDADGIAALIAQVKERAVAEIEAFHAGVADYMTTDPRVELEQFSDF